MKVNDAIVGALLVALAIAILVHIQGYPLIPGQKYGPALFPGLIAVGFIATGVLLVVRGLRSGAPPVRFAPWLASRALLTNFLAVVAALVFYIVAADRLGFVLTGFVLLLGLFVKFGVRAGRATLIAAIATLAIHAVFYKLLRVPLPWGLLERFAW
jgi:putative tricarboxylic transport membrane protein